MKRKVLVIGSNSFSGSTFVKFLLEKEFQVVGISRSPEEYRSLLPHLWSKNLNDYQFKQFDLNNDLAEIAAYIKNEKFEIIYNFAAQSMVGESWSIPEDWIRTNVYSLSSLIKQLVNFDFLERYIHITTPEVYGSTENWISESCSYNPSTPYAVSRAAADMLIKAYIDHASFPAIFTRAANVYGPGQQLYRIIPRTIFSALNGKTLKLHGGGYSERSFIFMDDVADATMRISTNGKVGETYHISTKELITIRALVKTILDSLDIDFNSVVQESGERTGKDQAYKLNSSKIRTEVGWEDKVSLKVGINRTIKWVKENITALRGVPENYEHKK